MISERFVGFGLVGLLVVLFALAGYKMMADADCRQLALAQNYPADAVKKICK